MESFWNGFNFLSLCLKLCVGIGFEFQFPSGVPLELFLKIFVLSFSADTAEEC